MIYSEVLALFNDATRDSMRTHFTDGQIDRFAHRALETMCERARYIDQDDLLSTNEDDPEYTVLSPGYSVYRVEYDNERLLPIATKQLRASDRNWRARTGYPKYYYLDEIQNSQGAFPSFGMFEAPQSATLNIIRAWYFKAPEAPVYTSPSEEVDIPDWAVGGMVFYMLHLAYLADTYLQNYEASALYMMMYEDVLDRLVIRSRDRNPKQWHSGNPTSPQMSVMNRLPRNIEV